MKPNFTHIIVHHSLTADGLAVDYTAIKRYHVEVKGWADVAYHFVTEKGPSGDYLNLVGRPLNRVGAHTIGMNEKAIGWLFVGNYDLAPPPVEMLMAAKPTFLALMEIFKIPVENVRGHRDYAQKSCPGKLFDLDLFREILG